MRLFIETLNVDENLHIAGHSLGGSIATVYASQYPFDTQSLFLINSAGLYKMSNTPYTKDPQALKDLIVSKPGDLQDVSRQLMQNPPEIPYQLQYTQENLLMYASENSTHAID